MSAHRKQHFIPRCYLSAWTDPSTPEHHEPYVWVFKRDGSYVKKRAPSNIFHEKDMYTVHMPDGGRDLVLEHGLSQLESAFVDIRIKLERNESLSSMERGLLCAFMAAMHGRTPTMREHQRSQWKAPLEQMDRMMERMRTATPNEKQRMAKRAPLHSNSNSSMTYEDVKRIVDDPMTTMLPVIIQSETPLLARLDFAILHTNDELGFITSDHPCVWYDAEAYKRPPLYRAPALMYPTIEITLPVSPALCILLNRQGNKGTYEASRKIVNSINRRTRFCCREHFVVCQNERREIWFYRGKEPFDSWENTQKQKGN